MQNSRFVVLTGHLSNYPLSDLVGILRLQRKSGRLLIEYPKGPATFFFQNGELIDARMNDLKGLQAICVALAQPEASFNFNPLIQSPRRSIEPSLQRAVSELFGCWDESALQIESTASSEAAPPARQPLPGRRSELLALPPAPASLVQKRSILFVAAAVVIVIGLSTVIAVTGGFKNDPPTAPQAVTQAAPVAAQPEVATRQAPIASVVRPNRPAIERKEEKRPKPEEKTPEVEAPKADDQSAQPIRVVMQIENGRVLKASVANHKPGMDNFEALALRIARQRRYPATTTGGETVTITVNR
ncbi:MAG TPA: DUF4388 domain-containing protein [Pyrinomonadaceae bacterium]|nr:DUF4388 domain-containing protein [Pyrinomonadaceae bacterium]